MKKEILSRQNNVGWLPIDGVAFPDDTRPWYPYEALRKGLSTMLPWKNPRFVTAFAVSNLAVAAVVFGVWWLTHFPPIVILAYTVILVALGILVWFFRSQFARQQTLRNVLLAYLGACILWMTSILLAEASKQNYALALVVVGFAVQWFIGKPQLKRLRKEIRQEKSQSAQV